MPKNHEQTSVDLLNAIRHESSEDYQKVVPVATPSNIELVGRSIIENSNLTNIFVDGLINKVGKTIYTSKMAQNNLRELKKGMLPFGAQVEEMFVEVVASEDWSAENTGDVNYQETLKRKKPSVKVKYHTQNRQSVFQVTISYQQLKTAFTSAEGVSRLMTQLMNNLYSSSNYEEFEAMKECVGIAQLPSLTYEGTDMKKVVGAIDSEGFASSFLKEVKIKSSAFTFMSDKFNKNKVKTHVPKEGQVLLIRSDVLATVNVDMLCNVFNLSRADFDTRVIEVDGFKSATASEGSGYTFAEDDTTLAILMDKDVLQVYDTLYHVTSQENAKGIYFNYFLHHHQILALSENCDYCRFATA